jgi:hypothetical protein
VLSLSEDKNRRESLCGEGGVSKGDEAQQLSCNAATRGYEASNGVEKGEVHKQSAECSKGDEDVTSDKELDVGCGLWPTMGSAGWRQ